MARSFSFNDTLFTVDDVLISSQVEWEIEKDIIKPKSYLFLDSLAVFLKEKDFLTIEVAVIQTKIMAKYEKNRSSRITLSRAFSIIEYLINKGIVRERLMGTFYGPEENVTNSMAENKAQSMNKTVFKILEVAK